MKTYIRIAQTALTNAGYSTNGIDGVFGKNSLIALQSLIANAKTAVDILDGPGAAFDPNALLIPASTNPPRASKEEIATAANELGIEPVVKEQKYKLSNTSLNRLKGIKPSLHRVVERALFLSDVDFMVVEGLRTRAKQAEYVRKGASQTMNSKHLTGDAVDIVPYVNGKADWDNWDNIFKMTTAMQKAAQELGVPIRWGGAWVVLNSQSDTPYQLVEQYKARQRRAGKKAFMDGVHFELI